MLHNQYLVRLAELIEVTDLTCFDRRIQNILLVIIKVSKHIINIFNQ